MSVSIRLCGLNALITHLPRTKSTVIATLQRHQIIPFQLQLTLEKTHIEQVHEHCVFGVTLDDEMKWQAHLYNLYKTSSNFFVHFAYVCVCVCVCACVRACMRACVRARARAGVRSKDATTRLLLELLENCRREMATSTRIGLLTQ